MLYIIMGVAGAGKTAVGQSLAHHLGCAFLEGDDFHPVSNIDKMTAGMPLTDADRAGWINAINARLRTMDEEGVVACSALKKAYRKRLLEGIEGKKAFRFVHLKISRRLARERISHRHHFFPEALIESQFNDLEAPSNGLIIDADQPVMTIVKQILSQTS